MTRQIALAIFLAATVTMVLAGVLTYAAARQTLLVELDRALISRALASMPRGDRDAASPPEGDRFVAEDQLGRTVARSRPTVTEAAEPEVVSREFTEGAGGERMRTLVLSLPAERGPIKIIYSSPATSFDRLQDRLAWTIGTTVAGGGVLTLLTAVAISRRVTRPLQRTADAIGAVDDAHLDARIDVNSVPRELAPMVRRLNEMLARLEAAFAGQRQFLADAAHELRTPVAAIRAGMEIALTRPRSAEHLEGAMRRSLRETVHMGAIVEAMLDCVRAGADRPLDPVTFDLKAVLAECIEQIEPLASAKQQSITADISGPLDLHSEVLPVRTVIRNLLSNAVAHTPERGHITLTAAAETGGIARIEVRDDGPGIAPAHVARLFEPFYRGDASRSDTSHLGLGLYIVRRHVTRLGGTVALASTLGRGASFVVRLPQLVRVAPEKPTLSAPAAGGAPEEIGSSTPLTEFSSKATRIETP